MTGFSILAITTTNAFFLPSPRESQPGPTATQDAPPHSPTPPQPETRRLTHKLPPSTWKASRTQRPHKTHRLISPPLWDPPPRGRMAALGLATTPANQAFCSQHAAGERSAAPPSPPFCTSAPTAARQCPLGSVLAGEQPDSSRSAAVSRSERSDHTPRPPLPALATDLLACSISRPSASKLSMINMVERNIKSWTTAARISRSERRSSEIPRAAKDRCQSNSIRHRSLISTRSFRMYRKRPLRAPCCCISRFGKSFPAVSASHNFSALLHPDGLIANSFTCSSRCLV